LNSAQNGYEHDTLTNVVPTYSGQGDQLFPHEVGHTYGIDDCTLSGCLDAVTIMEPDQADEPYAPMSPHCCDSKVMYRMSGSYGQSGQYCSPILVQGTAMLSLQRGLSASATFQQSPQSGDTIVVGCLGSYDDGDTFSVKDNQQVSGLTNTYSNPPIVSTYVSLGPPFGEPVANAALLEATQVVSSQSQQFTVTCSTVEAYSYTDVFALEYADLASGQNIDAKGKNMDSNGVSPLPCGNLSTTAINDLIVSLYNYNSLLVPMDSPASPALHPRGPSPDSGAIAPTLGTVPACTGGSDGYCISQKTQNDFPQPGGLSVYPQNTPPGPYTESWTAPLCSPEQDCINPMSCVSAAVTVIGP
jgi:hypothetical protein